MERVIYKYALEGQSSTINLPVHSQILTMQMQNGIPHIWVLAHTEDLQTTVPRVFKFFGTGWPIRSAANHRLDYIGTFQAESFVFHVFEEKEY